MAMGMAHGWVGGTIAIVLCQTSEIDAIPDTARLAARDNVRRKSQKNSSRVIFFVWRTKKRRRSHTRSAPKIISPRGRSRVTEQGDKIRYKDK